MRWPWQVRSEAHVPDAAAPQSPAGWAFLPPLVTAPPPAATALRRDFVSELPTRRIPVQLTSLGHLVTDDAPGATIGISLGTPMSPHGRDRPPSADFALAAAPRKAPASQRAPIASAPVQRFAVTSTPVETPQAVPDTSDAAAASVDGGMADPTSSVEAVDTSIVESASPPEFLIDRAASPPHLPATAPLLSSRPATDTASSTEVGSPTELGAAGGPGGRDAPLQRRAVSDTSPDATSAQRSVSAPTSSDDIRTERPSLGLGAPLRAAIETPASPPPNIQREADDRAPSPASMSPQLSLELHPATSDGERAPAAPQEDTVTTVEHDSPTSSVAAGTAPLIGDMRPSAAAAAPSLNLGSQGAAAPRSGLGMPLQRTPSGERPPIVNGHPRAGSLDADRAADPSPQVVARVVDTSSPTGVGSAVSPPGVLSHTYRQDGPESEPAEVADVGDPQRDAAGAFPIDAEPPLTDLSARMIPVVTPLLLQRRLGSAVADPAGALHSPGRPAGSPSRTPSVPARVIPGGAEIVQRTDAASARVASTPSRSSATISRSPVAGPGAAPAPAAAALSAAPVVTLVEQSGVVTTDDGADFARSSAPAPDLAVQRRAASPLPSFSPLTGTGSTSFTPFGGVADTGSGDTSPTFTGVDAAQLRVVQRALAGRASEGRERRGAGEQSVEVQRIDLDPPEGDAPPHSGGPPADRSSSAPGQGTTGSAVPDPSAPEQVEKLIDRIYPPLVRRLKAELLSDRERRGVRIDRV